MIGTTKRVAICAALLALGGFTAACGDDDDGGGTDAGRDAGRDSGGEDPMDAGTDGGGGGEDAGSDAGPPPAFIRLAHLISNAGSAADPTGSVHVCLQALAGSAQSLLTQRSDGSMTPTPIPYRGVSDYVSTGMLMLADAVYTVNVYPAAALTGTTCPAPAMAVFSIGIDAGELAPGNSYTIAAAGLIGGSGAQAPQLVVIEDDRTAPAAEQANVRLVHGLVNLPTNVDVCYDPDFRFEGGVPMPGEDEAVPLFLDQAFIGSELETPPVAAVEAIGYEGVPPVEGGLIIVYPRGAAATDCATANPLAPTAIRIPVPLPVPPAGTPNVPGNISAGATFDEGEIVSLFAVGDAMFTPTTTIPCCTGATPDTCSDTPCAGGTPAGQVCNPFARVCVHPRGPTVVPWVDNFAP